MFEYKGYWSDIRVVFNQDGEKIFVGRVIDIKDTITFQARRMLFVEREFHKAVDSYLQFCKDLGQKPSRPVDQKTSYQVAYPFRTSPAMRQLMQKESDRTRTTVNCWMEQALPSASASVQYFLDNRKEFDKLCGRLLPHLSRENLKSSTELFYALEKLLAGMDGMRALLDQGDRDAFAKVVTEIEMALNHIPDGSDREAVPTCNPVDQDRFVK